MGYRNRPSSCRATVDIFPQGKFGANNSSRDVRRQSVPVIRSEGEPGCIKTVGR